MLPEQKKRAVIFISEKLSECSMEQMMKHVRVSVFEDFPVLLSINVFNIFASILVSIGYMILL